MKSCPSMARMIFSPPPYPFCFLFHSLNPRNCYEDRVTGIKHLLTDVWGFSDSGVMASPELQRDCFCFSQKPSVELSFSGLAFFKK